MLPPSHSHLQTTEALTPTPILATPIGSSSGGYSSYIFQYAARELFGVYLSDEEVEHGCTERVDGYAVLHRPGRNPDYSERVLTQNGVDLLVFAKSYGFRNIQNIVRKVKPGDGAGGSGSSGRGSGRGRMMMRRNGGGGGAAARSVVHFAEVMACPSGCINGGGQLKMEVGSGGVEAPASKAFIAHNESVYQSVGKVPGGVQAPHENAAVISLYK
jgi:hypothetical protein